MLPEASAECSLRAEVRSRSAAVESEASMKGSGACCCESHFARLLNLPFDLLSSCKLAPVKSKDLREARDAMREPMAGLVLPDCAPLDD